MKSSGPFDGFGGAPLQKLRKNFRARHDTPIAQGELRNEVELMCTDWTVVCWFSKQFKLNVAGDNLFSPISRIEFEMSNSSKNVNSDYVHSICIRGPIFWSEKLKDTV